MTESKNINASEATEQSTNKGQTYLLGLESGGIGFSLGLVVIIIIFVTLNYFNILNLSQVVPLLSFLPHKNSNYLGNKMTNSPNKINATPTQTPLLSCAALPSQHSLVYTISVVKDRNGIYAGVYRGEIVSIQNAFPSGINLQITSLDKKETYTFNIDQGTVKVYDAVHHIEDIAFTVLKAGDHIEMSFNCNNKKLGNKFTIFSIGLIK